MKRAAWWMGVAILAGVGPGCQPSSGANVRNVVVDGSNVMAPLVRDIGKRFEADHPGVRVDVQDGGSERGIVDLLRRTRAGGK